jgi:methionyl aminopeptidase
MLVIELKSKAEIAKMAASGAIVARVLDLMQAEIREGITTQELDELAETTIRDAGGTPTFKGYRGFPASICASPNAMVVHGIPGTYAAAEGDVMSVDVGVTLDEYVADSAWTFPVGEISETARQLLTTCERALMAGIEQAIVGNHVGDISAAVQRETEADGFTVIRSLVGHGVGKAMHEEPQVPNFGEPGAGAELREGMTIAIEPMITAGTHEIVLADDEWSISTADASLSAHFEHTVAITASGPEILTLRTVAAPATATDSLLA